jgi:hypothetical protein
MVLGKTLGVLYDAMIGAVLALKSGDEEPLDAKRLVQLAALDFGVA